VQIQTSPRKSKRIRLRIDLIPSQRQNVWHRFAVINFAFGGAGAGLYIMSALVQVVSANAVPQSTLWILRLFAAGLVSVGLIAVAGEAGRPGRARYLLVNLRRSWMSRETLAAILFIPAAIASAYAAQPFLIGFTVGAGVMFIVAQAFVLHRSRAVPAWNVATLPSLVITSALVGGCGLLLLTPLPEAATTACAVMVSLCVSANLLCYALYLYLPSTNCLEEATAPIRNNPRTFWTIGIGGVLPTFALILGTINDPIPVFCLTTAGIALFAGSWIQKDGIIRHCGHLAPISLQVRLSPTDPRLQSKP
jgi:DMSO reductase anchor subunit